MRYETWCRIGPWRKAGLVAAGVAVLALAAVSPAMADGHHGQGRSHCSVEGTWLASVDIGAVFFVNYGSGATGTGGAMTIEWIGFDPTLFGSFPTAVRVSQAMGAWEQLTAATYRYTWIMYGFDASGAPLYAVRGSGTGTFPGCDAIVFDYVLEVFPYPSDPLADDPATCLSGSGSKLRIPVVQAECEG